MAIDEPDPHGERKPMLDTTLERIAGLLGCSVDALKDSSQDPFRGKGASELLALWFKIDDEDDRAQLIALARRLAKA